MQTPIETAAELSIVAEKATAPSVDFIQAVSQFLDTDPGDLLREMGYYKTGCYSRDESVSSE